MFQISDLAHPTGRVDASKAYPVQAPLGADAVKLRADGGRTKADRVGGRKIR